MENLAARALKSMTKASQNPQLDYKNPQLDYIQQAAPPDFCLINN
jgi:hypothetical protein